MDDARYFLGQNAARRGQLREALDHAAKRSREHEAISNRIGSADARTVERIHALGFNGDSVRIFDLLPLVHVSWADGKIQRTEREAIFSVLEERGIEPGSDASLLMEALLEQRPSETFLGETLDLLRTIAGGATASVVDLCARVADASGGLLGLGKRTSDAERALIAKVAAALGETAERRFQELFKQ